MTHRRPRQRQEVDLLRCDDEVMLCDRSGQALCTLNETAAALWELCDGQTSTDEMVEAVCQLFALPRETAAVDIESALARLRREGLVDWP